MYDLIILGGGPAGLSAALTARNRGKSTLVISGGMADSGLWKAGYVTNYAGVPEISGKELLERMTRQAQALGVEFLRARAQSAMPMGKTIGVAAGSAFEECGALILATGIAPRQTFPGEREFLGRGVSYCATCDGMLYRGKRAAVVGLSADAPEEAEFLRGIGCEVLYFDDPKQTYEIRGGETADTLAVGGAEYPVNVVFILRSAVAAEALLPNLETADGHIVTDASMATNIPGVFAAGDCTGAPYQIAAAAGEGNKAALSAAKYLREHF